MVPPLKTYKAYLKQKENAASSKVSRRKRSTRAHGKSSFIHQAKSTKLHKPTSDQRRSLQALVSKEESVTSSKEGSSVLSRRSQG